MYVVAAPGRNYQTNKQLRAQTIMYMYKYVCTFVYVYVYVYIYPHPDA